MKLVLPVAWQLFKPDVKQFISKELTLAVEEYKKKVINEIDKKSSYWRHPMALHPKKYTAQEELREMKVRKDVIDSLQLPEAPNTPSK